VALVNPVDYFGERALLEGDARNASVIARSARVVCLELDRATFNSAFGPVRHIMEREAVAQSSMVRRGADLRPLALLKDGEVCIVQYCAYYCCEMPLQRCCLVCFSA
jgi:CRP-like cAMP-binding protein